jgi:PEGA domain
VEARTYGVIQFRVECKRHTAEDVGVGSKKSDLSGCGLGLDLQSSVRVENDARNVAADIAGGARKLVFSMKRYMTILPAILLIGAVWANAASKAGQLLTVKVISAKTESIPLNSDNNGAPRDCNLMDFSAYCHHGRNAIVRHTMVVQDGSGKSFTISCTVDTIWSKCIALPVGVTFSAQQAKRGIEVWYPTAKGGQVKQLYAVGQAPDEPSVASTAQPDSSVANLANNAGTGTAAVSEVNRDTAKCNFTSTPSGAEISLDGSYVGNTPSAIAVGAGRHLVVLTMPGFSKWKRELLVSAGSDVEVSATLQARQ